MCRHPARAGKVWTYRGAARVSAEGETEYASQPENFHSDLCRRDRTSSKWPSSMVGDLKKVGDCRAGGRHYYICTTCGNIQSQVKSLNFLQLSIRNPQKVNSAVNHQAGTQELPIVLYFPVRSTVWEQTCFGDVANIKSTTKVPFSEMWREKGQVISLALFSICMIFKGKIWSGREDSNFRPLLPKHVVMVFTLFLSDLTCLILLI